MNNYRAGGSAGYSMFRGAKMLWRSPDEIRDLVIQYYREHKTLPAQPDNNWRMVPEAAHSQLEHEALAGAQTVNPGVITVSHFSAVMFVNAGRSCHAARPKAARASGRRNRKTASDGPL